MKLPVRSESDVAAWEAAKKVSVSDSVETRLSCSVRRNKTL